MSTIPDLLACAGLIHDIGNPPFGHFGEVVMSDWFKDNIKHLKYKGNKLEDIFTQQQLEDLYHLDGNAQALRVVRNCMIYIMKWNESNKIFVKYTCKVSC